MRACKRTIRLLEGKICPDCASDGITKWIFGKCEHVYKDLEDKRKIHVEQLDKEQEEWYMKTYGMTMQEGYLSIVKQMYENETDKCKKAEAARMIKKLEKRSLIK